MNRKIQKKAMKAFITDPGKTAIISAGEYIVLSQGNIGVHIKKEEALIRYEDRIAIDKITGEIHDEKLQENWWQQMNLEVRYQHMYSLKISSILVNMSHIGYQE